MSFRVLLVEDDTEIAAYVAQGLREEGLLITVANDGNAGLLELETSIWDLLILDWWLPGRDGITLLKRFREKSQTIPVLFLTARDAVAQRVAALNAGADDYLCKPFAFEELLARV
jgi:two-component system copper resistance phosphate regulon response regulator CusR